MSRDPIPETDGDRALLRRLLAAGADPWARLEDLGAALGIDRSTVSKYMSGTRSVAWHVVVAALRRTARRHPEAVPGIVETLAREVLDVRGRWVPESDEPTGTFEDENADVTLAQAELMRARREGAQPKLVMERARALVKEAEDAARAAVRAA